MKVVTEKQLVKTTAERYRKAQMDWEGKVWTFGETRRLNYEKIKALNPPTAKEIAEILGSTSYTSIRCQECLCEVKVAVEFDIDGADLQIHLCANCLGKALLLKENADE